MAAQLAVQQPVPPPHSILAGFSVNPRSFWNLLPLLFTSSVYHGKMAERHWGPCLGMTSSSLSVVLKNSEWVERNICEWMEHSNRTSDPDEDKVNTFIHLFWSRTFCSVLLDIQCKGFQQRYPQKEHVTVWIWNVSPKLMCSEVKPLVGEWIEKVLTS